MWLYLPPPCTGWATAQFRTLATGDDEEVEAALRAKAGTAGGGYKSGGGGSLGLGGDGGGSEPRQVLDLCDDLAGFEGLHQGETAQHKAEREALDPSHASPQVPPPPGRGTAAAAGGAHGTGAKSCAVLPGKLFEEDAAVLGELLKVVVGGSGEVHTTYLPTSFCGSNSHIHYCKTII